MTWMVTYERNGRSVREEAKGPPSALRKAMRAQKNGATNVKAVPA